MEFYTYLKAKSEQAGKASINDAKSMKILNFVRTEAQAQAKIEGAAYTFVKNQNRFLVRNILCKAPTYFPMFVRKD